MRERRHDASRCLAYGRNDEKKPRCGVRQLRASQGRATDPAFSLACTRATFVFGYLPHTCAYMLICCMTMDDRGLRMALTSVEKEALCAALSRMGLVGGGAAAGLYG